MNLAEWERAIEICSVVAARHGISIIDLQSTKRDAKICRARTEAVKAVKMGTRLSSVEIGKVFHRCHATILYYLGKLILLLVLSIIPVQAMADFAPLPVSVRAVDNEPGTEKLYKALMAKVFRNIDKNFGKKLKIFSWESVTTSIPIQGGCSDIYRLGDVFCNTSPKILNLYVFDTVNFSGCAYLCPPGEPEMVAVVYISKHLRRVSRMIIRHEVGHIIGAYHDEDPYSVMFHGVNTNKRRWTEQSKKEILDCLQKSQW